MSHLGASLEENFEQLVADIGDATVSETITHTLVDTLLGTLSEFTCPSNAPNPSANDAALFAKLEEVSYLIRFSFILFS